MINKSTTVRNLTNSTSVTTPYTVPSSFYRLLVVGVHGYFDGSGYTVTYNGVAMTQSTQYNLGQTPERRMTLYYLIAPASGTNDVVVTSGGGSGVFGVHVTSLTGVDQTTPINVISSVADAGGLMTVTFTTTADDCVGVGVVYNYGGGTYVDGTNFDLFGNDLPYDYGISPTSLGAAGSKTMTCGGSSNSQAALIMAIKPAVLIAILSSTSVTGIGLRSAVGNGSIDYDGDQTITERGVCIKTSSGPTTADTKFSTSGTLGSFSVNMTGLAVNTIYYARSYAINGSGTAYGPEISFTTNNIASTELTKNITAIEGATYAVSLRLTGTLGTVTAKLGRNGGSAVFNATGGVQTMQGVYSGADGIILTRSANFNGTIDDLLWVRVVGGGSINWASTTLTTVLPISSEVFFARVEDKEFNTYRLYRFLDLLFKDLNGYVTVTVKRERDDGVITIASVFSVGNTSIPASPFSKKRVSFLCKDQAIIIGLSNASLNETFAIAKFMLTGHKRTRKMFGADKIISI